MGYWFLLLVFKYSINTYVNSKEIGSGLVDAYNSIRHVYMGELRVAEYLRKPTPQDIPFNIFIQKQRNLLHGFN